MTDKKLVLLLLFWGTLSLQAGFTFAHTPYEFIFTQACEALLLIMFLLVSHKYKIATIILCGYILMSSWEVLDEIRKVNTGTRFHDYFRVLFGFIGIAVGVIRYYYLKKKKKQ